MEGGRRCYVEKIDNHEESFRPKCRRKTSLKKKSTNGVIDGSNHSFRLPFFLGGIQTRETHLNALRITKGVKLSVIVLTTIITLELFYVTFKMIVNIISKMKKFVKHLRFCFKGINPYMMRILI